MAGKEGISYEQVKSAAEGLAAEGRKPSIRSVRERLNGTGSPNTIHKHLTKWQDAQPASTAQTIDLAPSIIREINGEIQRAAAGARSLVEAELVQARAEAADLSTAGLALEAERDALTEKLAGLTSERDILAGKAAEQAAELERLSQELERERKAAEEARIEVAQGRLASDAQRQQLEELRSELARLRDESAQERVARIASERNLAGAAAARDGLAERVADLQEREQSALRDLVELRARLERSQEAANAAHVEAGELRGQVVGMRDALRRAGIEEGKSVSPASHPRTMDPPAPADE